MSNLQLLKISPKGLSWKELLNIQIREIGIKKTYTMLFMLSVIPSQVEQAILLLYTIYMILLLICVMYLSPDKLSMQWH